jgi:hypothetical protein
MASASSSRGTVCTPAGDCVNAPVLIESLVLSLEQYRHQGWYDRLGMTLERSFPWAQGGLQMLETVM